MAIETKKQLVLKRVPPGDQWTDAVDDSDVFESLTDGLEYVFQKSNGQLTEFHLSAFKGEIFSVVNTEIPDPEPTVKRWTLYGEEIDKQQEIKMDTLNVWNELTYLDGILFTVWLGILYYGKCWIDSRFK